MDNQEIEREIDIKDAVFYLLYHWRSILVGALIGLILLAGYKYISFDTTPVSEVSEEQKAYDREVKIYKLNKASYDTQTASYEKQLKQLQNYMETSLLMKIDPMQESYASAELYVEIALEDLAQIPESANMDVADQVLGAYESFINKGIDLSTIAKDNGVKESMIKELVYAAVDYDANMVNVEVIAPDDKLADQIMKAVIKQTQGQTEEISESIRMHRAVFVNETQGVRSDDELLDKISNMYNQVSSIQSALTNVMTNAESLEEPVEQDFSVSAGPVAVSKKTLLKFGLIGFVVGAFVMCGVYACTYLFAGVLATEEELKDAFGCFLLGAFAPGYKKQSALDRLLYRMAGVEKRADDVISTRIAQNVISLAKPGQKILLTGTVSDELLQDTMSILKDKVQDIQLTVSGCFTEDASAIGMVSAADKVIVVEKRRESKFAEVQKLLETISNMDKPVMGYIMY
ncbi:MAG: hypothetical protein PUD03_06705 [Lachnospiraceae bacterium]|nr:hypothetical protein [Lachnospiraceae bacterium]